MARIQEKYKAIQLRKKGGSIKEISEKINVPKSTVKSAVKI